MIYRRHEDHTIRIFIKKKVIMSHHGFSTFYMEIGFSSNKYKLFLKSKVYRLHVLALELLQLKSEAKRS